MLTVGGGMRTVSGYVGRGVRALSVGVLHSECVCVCVCARVCVEVHEGDVMVRAR